MKRIIFSVVFLLSSISFCQNTGLNNKNEVGRLYEDGIQEYAKRDNGAILFSGLEIPRINPNDDIVKHKAYTLSYSEEHEQAYWVAYELTKEKTISKFKRGDKFIPDPFVKSGSADNRDYSRSGYDRGHLAPAADMAFSKVTIDESFYFSNMSPQVPSFNRGIWKKLEEQVRDWAREYKKLYVITGPILEKGLKTIGNNKVSVPKYYYKVLLRCTGNDTTAIGFILPNKASTKQLQSFAVSVDSVEAVTSIDFFVLLSDSKEENVEKIVDINQWFTGYNLVDER